MTNTQPDVCPAPAATRWWRTKKARLALTVVGVSLIVLARFSLAEKHQVQQATTAAKQEITSFLVGDCVGLSAGGTDAHRTDCATDPSFTVGAVMNGDQPCAEANDLSYDWSLDNHVIGRLCLAANFSAGHCYRPTPSGRNYEQVDCTTSDDRAFTVLSRFDTPADHCPPGATTESHTSPVRTYCLTPTAGSHGQIKS